MAVVTLDGCGCCRAPILAKPVSASIPFKYEPNYVSYGAPYYTSPYIGEFTGDASVTFRIYYGYGDDAPYDEVTVPVNETQLDELTAGNQLYFKQYAVSFVHDGLLFEANAFTIGANGWGGPYYDYRSETTYDSVTYHRIDRDNGCRWSPVQQ